MNLRTRYKKLKQYVEFTKLTPVKVFFDSTNLEHFRFNYNLPLIYAKRDVATDELALRVSKDKLKEEFSKLIDEYIEILPVGTIALDIWLKPKSSLSLRMV